jgi:hypothetical protein
MVQPNQYDLDIISPNFQVVPCLLMHHTLDHSTRLPLRKIFKSRFPAVSPLNEVVATETYFSDTPALDNGINVTWRNKYGSTFLWLFQPSHCCLPNAA